jgi:adenylate cyclase
VPKDSDGGAKIGAPQRRGNVLGNRRLAAVAFIDIVGYSALVIEDDVATHKLWLTFLNEVVRPTTTRFDGQIVKSTGDGVLAEFRSAHDAVEWGQDIQHSIKSPSVHSLTGSAVSRISLRVSVNIGDVFSTPDDIYGEGVNVAARLQEYGEPGGLIISEAVYDLVRGTYGSNARDLGLLKLKNLEKPVRAYSIHFDVKAVTGSGKAAPVLPPSIAILPLTNLGDKKDDEYFALGVTDDVITSLSGLRELTVISRTSTLIYGKIERPDVREIGRALGARYLMTGSLQRSAQRIKASFQLSDSQTGANIWGASYFIAQGELFEVQDAIVEKVVADIVPYVRSSELQRALRKRPENFSAYDLTLRALNLVNEADQEAFNQAKSFLFEAISYDPNFALPYAWISRWHSLNIGRGWSVDQDDDCKWAAHYARKAIGLDQRNAVALATFAHVCSYLIHDYETALIYFDRALAACPSSSLAWMLSSGTLSYLGRGEQAVRHAKQALKLSPYDPNNFEAYMFLGLANFVCCDLAAAVKFCKISLREKPNYSSTLRILIVCLMELNQPSEAQMMANKLLEVEPDFNLSQYERRQPIHATVHKQRFLEGLQKAGLPF